MYNSGYSNSRENMRRSDNTVVSKEIPELDKKTYVKQAEKVINKLSAEEKYISSSQIRNILTLINEVYNIIQHDPKKELSDEVQGRAQYVKMRIAYNAGREPLVKKFVLQSNIMEYIDRAGSSRDKLMLVCNYMEALVAYHKFIRGVKD